MRNLVLKATALLALISIFINGAVISAHSENDGQYNIETNIEENFDCKSVILMEAATGTVLHEKNADQALPPASVTKIMTLLLVMEACNSNKIQLTDMVTASAHACSMGGSQIYLKEGEQMSVEDMIKSVVIASANDAAVALAEHIEGSEEAFVKKMNVKARELGMENTNFENTNGLDDTALNHVTSARDIAIMSRELIKHDKITEYSSIWMDTIRNGEFGLTNTNRLVRFYKGATGLKTGSTSKAGFCISATATRNGMTLICVVMSAPTRDIRNQIATKLLDWGFSNFMLYKNNGEVIDNIKVTGGAEAAVSAAYPDFCVVLEKNMAKEIEVTRSIPDSVQAPVVNGQTIGFVTYKIKGQIAGEVPLIATETIEKMDFYTMFYKIFSKIIFKI